MCKVCLLILTDDFMTGPEITEQELAMPTAAELDLIRRKAAAEAGLRGVAEVIGESSVPLTHLILIADEKTTSPARRTARRIISALAALASPNSELAAAVGNDTYSLMEATIDYTASHRTYLELMQTYDLTPAEVTGIYALRDMIAQYTNGDTNFPVIVQALERVQISPQQVAQDPEAVVRTFEEAGFFVSYIRGKVYDFPIFRPDLKNPRWLMRTSDTPTSRAATENRRWLKRQLDKSKITQRPDDMREFED